MVGRLTLTKNKPLQKVAGSLTPILVDYLFRSLLANWHQVGYKHLKVGILFISEWWKIIWVFGLVVIILHGLPTYAIQLIDWLIVGHVPFCFISHCDLGVPGCKKISLLGGDLKMALQKGSKDMVKSKYFIILLMSVHNITWTQEIDYFCTPNGMYGSQLMESGLCSNIITTRFSTTCH